MERPRCRRVHLFCDIGKAKVAPLVHWKSSSSIRQRPGPNVYLKDMDILFMMRQRGLNQGCPVKSASAWFLNLGTLSAMLQGSNHSSLMLKTWMTREISNRYHTRKVSNNHSILLNYIWKLTLLATEMLLLQLMWFHSCPPSPCSLLNSHFLRADECLKSVSVHRFKLRLDIGTGPQRESMRRLAPRTETHRPPWVGRCTWGAGRHRCRRSWRCSARIWSRAWWRAVK